MATKKRETRKALAERLVGIQGRLEKLTAEERKAAIEELIRDFFVTARMTLVKWSDITGQTAQIDTGYIAQHLASLLLSQPGQGFRGKGVDLLDGSEVKSASFVAGYDWPRWNHNLATVVQDEKKQSTGKRTNAEVYLDAPTVVYVLFDHPQGELGRLRVRVWCINGREDTAWRTIIERFQESKSGNTYNLQLHPPTNRDDELVTNELGNLRLDDVKIMEVEFQAPDEGDDLQFEWRLEPSYRVAPVKARAKLEERAAAEEPPAEGPLDIPGLTDLGAFEDEEPELQDAAVVVRPAAPEDDEGES
jgi:hypothetical protein